MDNYDEITAVVNPILLTIPNYPWIITVPWITQRGYPRFCMHWCCWSRFSISQLSLKAGSSVTCAFSTQGLDNVYLEAFRHILRQNYSEAE